MTARHHIIARCTTGLVIILALAMFTPVLLAAEASMQVTRREGYVGSPLPIKLIITNAESETAPEMPHVPGLSIERLSTPSVSSQTSIINGVTSTKRTVEWTFLLNAAEPGTYTIPSFTLNVDDTAFRTTPVQLTFVSSDADDLLRVAVTGEPDRIYLGESTTLTLQIWIKPYNDLQYNTELSSRDMWNLVDPQSDWGPFSDAVKELYGQRKAPRGRLVTVPGTDGQGLAYLYEINVDSWPDRTGPIGADEVQIGMQYPLSLTRSRGFFNSGLSIEDSRFVSATPSSSDVIVESLPSEGQPSWFSGAVGRFVFDITASPTDVAVGDPITLTMTVTDRGQRPANLELLQAPRLDHMKELDSDFRVPREQLGGTIQGRSKIFTQTIRATSDKSTEIPSLPFSSFDPSSDKYVTSWSKPIAITVSPASTITTSNVVGGTVRSMPDELKNVSGGILANYTGESLLQDQSVKPSWGLLLLLVIPPLAFTGVLAMNHRRIQLQENTGYARSRSALRTATHLLNDATQPGDVAAALSGYVADRLDLQAAGLTRSDLRRQLEDRSIDPALINSLDGILMKCEQHQYAGSNRQPADSLINEARNCLKDLEGARLR